MKLADSRFIWGLKIKGMVLGNFMMLLAHIRGHLWDLASLLVSHARGWCVLVPTPRIQGRLANSASRCFVFSSSHRRRVPELAVSSLRSSLSEESRAVWKSPVSLPSRNLTSLSPSSSNVVRDGWGCWAQNMNQVERSALVQLGR